jgi:hypothetical protein
MDPVYSVLETAYIFKEGKTLYWGYKLLKFQTNSFTMISIKHTGAAVMQQTYTWEVPAVILA